MLLICLVVVLFRGSFACVNIHIVYSVLCASKRTRGQCNLATLHLQNISEPPPPLSPWWSGPPSNARCFWAPRVSRPRSVQPFLTTALTLLVGFSDLYKSSTIWPIMYRVFNWLVTGGDIFAQRSRVTPCYVVHSVWHEIAEGTFWHVIGAERSFCLT